MPNSNVFAANTLPTIEMASNIIRYNSFSTSQTNTVLWTPAAGKSIYLTGISMTTLVSLNATLQRAGNAPFLAVQFSSLLSLAPYNISFSSPIKFNVNESISITTSAVGTFNVTLFGYEQ